MRIEDKDKIFITPAFLSDIVYLFIYCLLLVRLCSNISNVSLALTQTLMRLSGKCEDILAYKNLQTYKLFPSFKSKNWIRFYLEHKPFYFAKVLHRNYDLTAM